MNLSNKTIYAIRALIILSKLPSNESIQAHELSKLGNIPIKFLEQILLNLKKSGFIESKRGTGGGHKLTIESRLISIADIIKSIEGEIISLTQNNSVTSSIIKKGSNSYDIFEGANYYLSKVEKSFVENLQKINLEEISNYKDHTAGLIYGSGI